MLELDCLKDITTRLHGGQRPMQAIEIIQEEVENSWARVPLGSWTSDFPMYAVENGRPVLYFAPCHLNLALAKENIIQALNDIDNNGFYVPKPDEAARVVESAKSGEALRLELLSLGLQSLDEEKFLFEFETEKPNTLNLEQRAFAERIYGRGEDFSKSMDFFANHWIRKLSVIALNPDYVMANASQHPISRICWLFGYRTADFTAADTRVVDSEYGAVHVGYGKGK